MASITFINLFAKIQLLFHSEYKMMIIFTLWKCFSRRKHWMHWNYLFEHLKARNYRKHSLSAFLRSSMCSGGKAGVKCLYSMLADFKSARTAQIHQYSGITAVWCLRWGLRYRHSGWFPWLPWWRWRRHGLLCSTILRDWPRLRELPLPSDRPLGYRL